MYSHAIGYIKFVQIKKQHIETVDFGEFLDWFTPTVSTHVYEKS